VRLSIAQGWLFTNREQSDEDAAALAEAPSNSPRWQEFAAEVLDALTDKWSFFDYHGEWGVVDLPEPASVEGLEIVHFVVTEGGPTMPIRVEAGEPCWSPAEGPQRTYSPPAPPTTTDLPSSGRLGRVLPANEQQAIERGLSGLCWWEDTEVLDRRYRERLAARYEL
jgi:hypothetical protein